MNVPPGVSLLVADWGIGDYYLVGGFADAVKRHYGLRVWMAGSEHRSFLGQLYPAVESYVAWPTDSDAQAMTSHYPESGKVFYAHFPKIELMRAVGYNGFHFLDAYRCRLGLPVGSNLTRPRPPTAAELASASSFLRENGFAPGNTALLSIEARTTPTDGIDLNFWTTLAAELQTSGFDVAINAGPTTKIPDGLRGLNVPLSTFRAVAQSAGFFCSVRSGLSDLACDLRCPQVVVYPDVRYWAGTLLEGTTFGRFGLTKTPHEVVIRRGYGQSDVAAIAGYLAARKPKGAPMAVG